MRYRHPSIVVGVTLCLIALTVQARSETATFDDVDVSPAEFAKRLSKSYKGLHWSGVTVVNSTHETLVRYPQCGYRTGLISGEFVAVVTNRYGDDSEIESPNGVPFDFTGVHLTAGWRDGLLVHLEGLRQGDLLHTADVEVGTAHATSFSFDFRGIDTLRIRTSGGTDAGICDSGCRPGPEVVLDDFIFSLPGEVEAGGGRLQRTAGQAREASMPLPEGVSVAAVAPPALGDQVSGGLVEKQPVWAGESGSSPAAAETPAEMISEESSAGEPVPRSCHGVQVGVFRSPENADQLRERLSREYGVALMLEEHQNEGPIYRVVVGCNENRDGAVDLLQELAEKGVQGFVVQVNEPQQERLQ